MAETTSAKGMTGTRIRRRRLDRGMKQADLARACGISPSYLNLIEHDKRSIGGKLLAALAEALDIAPDRLRVGADRQEVAALRAAAADMTSTEAETARAEDLAAQFPGWARLIDAQARRIASLERTVEVMGDRLTHDPQLAASLHNILSTVTAIRSTSAILAGDDPVDPSWQERFHRNLLEESQRLAEATGALVAEFDTDLGAQNSRTPLEEVEEWLDGVAAVPEADAGGDAEVLLIEEAETALGSEPARALARREIARLFADARAVPGADLRAAFEGLSPDPLALADRFGVPLPVMLRRLAVAGGVAAGLVACDVSGTLTRHRRLPGFAVPRFGAACAVWPLYEALLQVGRPVVADLVLAGQGDERFAAWAIAETRHPGGYQAAAVTEATMLVMPAAGRGARASVPELTVGSSCRVCPAESCAARRELSILGQGL